MAALQPFPLGGLLPSRRWPPPQPCCRSGGFARRSRFAPRRQCWRRWTPSPGGPDAADGARLIMATSAVARHTSGLRTDAAVAVSGIARPVLPAVANGYSSPRRRGHDVAASAENGSSMTSHQLKTIRSYENNLTVIMLLC